MHNVIGHLGISKLGDLGISIQGFEHEENKRQTQSARDIKTL